MQIHSGLRSLPPRPRPQEAGEESSPTGRRLPWAAIALGAVSVVGVCSPASAQVKIATPDQLLKTTLADQFRPQTPSAQWSVSVSQQNDSMPEWLEGVPSSTSNRKPGLRQADDDGWTAELRLQATRTQGDDQWTGGVRYSMLTQRGAWAPVASDYRGYRTDLGEVLLQHNQRVERDNGSTLYTALGGGVQAIGNLGGHTVQEQFHLHGGFGGRTGPALQSNQTSQGVTLTPLVTAGLRLDQPLNVRSLSLKSSLYTSLAVGRGLSTVQGQLGLHFQPAPRFHLEAGVTAAGVHSSHAAMDFLPASGIRAGAYVESDVKVSKHVRAFGRVQTGGIQGEPVYSIGFAIGGGPGAWINPGFQ